MFSERLRNAVSTLSTQRFELSAVECKKAIKLYKDRQYKEAISLLDLALFYNDKNTDAYKLRAWIHHRLGNYDRAIEEISNVINLNQKDVVAYRVRINMQLNVKNSDYLSVIADATKLLILDNENINCYNARAIAYEKIGEHTKAIHDASEAIRLNKQAETLGYISRANSKLQLQKPDYQSADDDITQAIKSLAVKLHDKDEQITELLNAPGLETFDSLWDNEYKIRDLMYLDYQFISAYLYSVEVKLKRGDYKSALTNALIVIRFIDRLTLGYANELSLYLNVNNPSVVLRKNELTDAIKYHQAKKGIFLGYMASAMFHLGDYSNAILHASDAMKLSREMRSSDLYVILIKSKRNKGDYPGAILQATVAINSIPNNLEVYRLRAAIYKELRMSNFALLDEIAIFNIQKKSNPLTLREQCLFYIMQNKAAIVAQLGLFPAVKTNFNKSAVDSVHEVLTDLGVNPQSVALLKGKEKNYKNVNRLFDALDREKKRRVDYIESDDSDQESIKRYKFDK